MITGWEVGSEFNEIKNFKDIDDKRIYITEEEINTYFSDVHSVNYTPITENIIKNKTNKTDAQLPNALYKKIKGWWTENSSGGYNYKIVKIGMLLEIIILDRPVCLVENGIEKYLMEKFTR